MKRVVVVTVCVAMLVLGHRTLFRGVYNFLISEDPLQNIDFVAVVNGDPAAVDHALQLVHDGRTRSVLIVERRTPRIVQIGAVPGLGERIKSDLIARGVPAASVYIVPTDAVTIWQLARELDRYLRSTDPIARVAVLYPEHQTRYLRWIVDRAVEPDRVDRFDVWSFSPRAFNADTWWSRRSALVKVAIGYLRLIHVVGFGEGEFDSNRWSLQAYEQSLAARQGAKVD